MEVVLVELKVILVGYAVEVKSCLPFQVVVLIIYMVSNAACGIEVVASYLWVTVRNPSIISTSDNPIVGFDVGLSVIWLQI